jgi:hypothetical protein
MFPLRSIHASNPHFTAPSAPESIVFNRRSTACKPWSDGPLAINAAFFNDKRRRFRNSTDEGAKQCPRKTSDRYLLVLLLLLSG